MRFWYVVNTPYMLATIININVVITRAKRKHKMPRKHKQINKSVQVGAGMKWHAEIVSSN